jgi:hypothetical protein
MGSPSEPTVSDEAAPIQESLEQASALTENGIEKATISNEHREMTLSPLELAQASEVFPERADTGNATSATDAQYDILLGTTQVSPQYGILGEVSGRKVALDLNETHTISLFGRFLRKNFPAYNAATGRIRISHLGKSGWRSKRLSTSCIAFLPSAIPL